MSVVLTFDTMIWLIVSLYILREQAGVVISNPVHGTFNTTNCKSLVEVNEQTPMLCFAVYVRLAVANLA